MEAHDIVFDGSTILVGTHRHLQNETPPRIGPFQYSQRSLVNPSDRVRSCPFAGPVRQNGLETHSLHMMIAQVRQGSNNPYHSFIKTTHRILVGDLIVAGCV